MNICWLRMIACGIHVLAMAAGCAGYAGAEETPGRLWHARLQPDRWTKIHEQGPADAVRFVRQRHAGAAFDTRRGRVILFGSDTHGRDWTNSPLFFDTGTLTWHRAYPDDPPETYTVDGDGVPVAGVTQDRPWAMHTFGAITYDARRDELVVASYPAHLAPGRFTDAMTRIWTRIDRHPTWTYRLGSDTWQPLAAEAVHFFPHATAYDTHRGVVIGYRSDGVFELDGEPRRWRRITGPGLLGYHNNAVYDSASRVLVVFGSNENRNDVVVYRPETGEHRVMPTPGPRPPVTQHVPMAFHPRLRRTVVLVGSPSRPPATDTWLYDAALDRWERVDAARLPLPLGMNYNLVYDPAHDVLLLVTGGASRPTSVWALRLRPDRHQG